MKIDRLDAHDRYQSFTGKEFDIGACCQDLIDKRPFGNHPFYIFAHTRTEEDGSTKRLIWQPRLSKPTAQSNSMLFKAWPGTDKVAVIWMIPDRPLWEQYEKGKVTENKIVSESIHLFKNDRKQLERPEDGDMTDDQIQDVLLDLYPHLFRRDTLPEEKKSIWDQKMREKESLKQREGSSED